MRQSFRGLILALGVALSLLPSAVSAETVVLVQGYLGSAGSWRNSGIGAILNGAGWSDAGHLTMHPGGVAEVLSGAGGNRRFITVDLLTEAPTVVQADTLAAYVAHIRQRSPGERIILVGHSAGGVVARLFMVRQPQAGIAGLVTIASPHLGSSWAELGNFIGSTPAAWMAPFFGLGTLNRSQALYHDLSREHPNNLLGWLNRQPHPPASYVAVVRVNNPTRPVEGDSMVVGPAQDLNAVPALAGRAETIFSAGEHGLRPDDGLLLSSILGRLTPG